MKTLSLLILAVASVLVLAGGVSAATSATRDAVVPFRVSYQCLPEIRGVENGCLVQVLPCAGQATHLGKSTWYSGDARSCFDGSQYGTMLFTAANGDTLAGNFVGTHAGYPGPVTFRGDFWITGGTGRFEGVTGTGSYGGTASGGEGTLYFDGLLTK